MGRPLDLAVTVLGLATAVAVADTRVASSLGDALDFILYGPVPDVWLCPVGEPRDLEGFRLRAHAAVRVLLDTQFTNDVQVDDGTEVWTFHEATVLEVFPGAETNLRAGQRLAITEWRGWDPPRTTFLTRLLPFANILAPRTEWILFLEWEPGLTAPIVVSFEDGAFQVVDGRIRMRSQSAWAMEWDGKPVSVLVGALHGRLAGWRSKE